MNDQELAEACIWKAGMKHVPIEKRIADLVALLNKERPEDEYQRGFLAGQTRMKNYCFKCGCDKQAITCADCNKKTDGENAKLKEKVGNDILDLMRMNARFQSAETENKKLKAEKKELLWYLDKVATDGWASISLASLTAKLKEIEENKKVK